jgi:two-component system, LytTR family, response regulator LytT
MDIYKIIVVEDDALIADSLKMLLEGFGYDVSAVCNTYQEAIVALQQIDFDLLLTDINLGKGIDVESGIQVGQYCKTHCNKPIIYLTAYADKDTISKSALASPAGYLVKPINENTLFATIQLALANIENKTALDKPEDVDYLFIKIGTTNFKVFWKEVYRVEALKNYVKLYTVAGQSNLLIRSSLLNFTRNILPPTLSAKFVKISRADLIAKDIIVKYNKTNVETTQGVFELGTEFTL